MTISQIADLGYGECEAFAATAIIVWHSVVRFTESGIVSKTLIRFLLDNLSNFSEAPPLSVKQDGAQSANVANRGQFLPRRLPFLDRQQQL